MISDVYYGEIKKDKLGSWNDNKDPFDILQDNMIIQVSGWYFLDIAKLILREEVKVDWGSYAYKANKKELSELAEKLNCVIPDFDKLEDNVEYGVVFVEGA